MIIKFVKSHTTSTGWVWLCSAVFLIIAFTMAIVKFGLGNVSAVLHFDSVLGVTEYGKSRGVYLLLTYGVAVLIINYILKEKIRHKLVGISLPAAWASVVVSFFVLVEIFLLTSINN